MVVSCQKCRTRFQLDEARIPAKGVRVRCSKCKHAFFVAPPASHDETIHGLAREAAVHGRPAKPRLEASVDLPPVSSGGEPEDDWEFNIDPPGAAGAAAAAPHPREDFDDSTPPPAEITDSEPTESDSVESFFELDGLSDPGPERAHEAPGRSAPPPPPDPPAAAAAPAPAKAKARKVAPPPIEPEQEVTFEDLGSPENWDFGVPEKPRTEKAPAKPPKPTKKAARATVEEAPPAVKPQPELRRRSESALGSLAGAAGWLLALALFGFGVHGTLRAGTTPLASLPPVAVGSLELADLRIRHVENLFAGPVVVVTGELRNPGSAAVPGAAGRIRVTDARGELLDAAPAWLGLILSPAELRQGDPAALAAAQARSARVLAERSFEPQDRLTVTAVLVDLPPGAAAFRIEEGPLAELPDPERLPSEPAPATAGPLEGAEDPAAP